MKKWFLCTPRNLTPKGKEWYDKLQEEYKNIELLHWGESEFNNFIRSPQLEGITNYFFGELELSIEWFKSQVNKQLKYIEKRYITLIIRGLVLIIII